MKVDGEIVYPEGALTLNEARQALLDGVPVLANGVTVIDLSRVTQVDSSALSLLMSWQRQAQAHSRPLNFRNLPESLLSLSRLYGVDDLIH